MSGEVVVAREGAGRLELFFERRPLCVVEGALPSPLAAALDVARLTPEPGLRGVVRDEHYEAVVELVRLAGSRLAAKLAEAPAPEGFTSAFVQLAFWVGSDTAWTWKGKKTRGKKQPPPEALPGHPLLGTPLLRATDGGTLSLHHLMLEQRSTSRVEVAKRGGSFLKVARRAWWPREGEAAWAAPMALTLVDVTAELELADSIRRRPRFERVASPLPGAWRERVLGAPLEGEVALQDAPSGTLTIEVLHERLPLEIWSSAHPVGGVARVDSSAVTPDATWTAVKRDAAFKALVSATEAALERLLTRRLTEDTHSARVWGAAALGWRLGKTGPLAELLPVLPLFRDVRQRPVTVGEVLELARARKKVPLATPREGVQQGSAQVLLEGAQTRELLRRLELPFEDVTAELLRAHELELALTSRRLASLTWQGEALAKLAVDEGPLKGELALSADPGAKPGITLAREGIAVQALDDAWPGVVGVVDVQGLTVDSGWTSASPTNAQKRLIRAQVERLFFALAEAAPSFSQREREVAAGWALRFLSDAGVQAPAHLDRLVGAARALAEAPLFITADGERVTLGAVANELAAAGSVAVLPPGVGGGTTSCVLTAARWDTPWLEPLEQLFGGVRRITDARAWREERKEADPPAGAAELHGLRFLRRELRLLRSGALGRLAPDDLEDVRLSREGGATALRYERKRKLALLDPEHPDVARALKEARQRPERMWVLLAAIFGEVNRALDHVTDAHEAQLVLALAAHLAHNPPLLRGGEGRGEEEP